MDELKKQSLSFTANMSKKPAINEPPQSQPIQQKAQIQKAPIMKRLERKSKKYESDSGAWKKGDLSSNDV